MNSAAEPTAAFLAAVRQSNLLSAAQISELKTWATNTHVDVPGLAKEINRRRWLTAYQIKEIFKGRGRELTLGPYVLLDLLGEGGMGRVFKASHTRLGRDVAIKIIRKEKLSNPVAEARFRQEIEALAQMSHPNVVTAYDADQIDNVHFCVMEYIDGTDLTKLVREKGPMPVAEACDCIRQAALGLQHAFEIGLVHRDIKPSNLLLATSTRQVKLVDLGLARLSEPSEGDDRHRITQDGFVIGTPDFLAPEQARDAASVDIRADIYSLGGTLFYLLTGKVPFEGGNATDKLLRHCTEPPPPVRQIRPDVPELVERIILWCMAKSPDSRPQTPLELALALQPLCPPPSPGTSGFVPGSGGHIALPGVPLPLPLPLPKPDPAPSSQIFRLPADVTPATTARARKNARSSSLFPVALLGALVLAGLLGYGGYRAFQDPSPLPIEPFTNSVGMKMVRIEGGTFRMGSPDTEPGRLPDEGPVHEVTIPGPFLISATEVTNAQYRQVSGRPTPSRNAERQSNAGDFPVENVSYEDTLEFCRKLTERDKDAAHSRPGWAYRLPTEAEWEYACRAGTETPFFFGLQLTSQKQARVNIEADAPAGPLRKLPGRVGQTEPNAFGLYDMHGNVAEWCSDGYRRTYPEGPSEAPTGPAEPTNQRVVRGGSFRDPPERCRSASRRAELPGYHGSKVDVAGTDGTIGFRVVYAPVRR